MSICFFLESMQRPTSTLRVSLAAGPIQAWGMGHLWPQSQGAGGLTKKQTKKIKQTEKPGYKNHLETFSFKVKLGSVVCLGRKHLRLGWAIL